MTTRPGNAALALWGAHRTLRACHLVKVIRSDGYVLRFTDHDRTLSFEGESYVPAIFAGLSAESRESGGITPGQQMHGIVDGDTIAIPDMLGRRYVGAEVYHVVTDWQWPWLAIARHYKVVRTVEWDGIRWLAQLDGITRTLDRPSGGRFDGVLAPECNYRLGDADTCRATISADVVFGARVETVTDDRLEFTLDNASFAWTYDDDYYRDGEMQWKWAAPVHEGNENAGATSLTESGAGWTTDEHVGRYVLILNATDGYVEDRAVITANTTDTLTYETLPVHTPGVTDYAIAANLEYTDFISPIINSVGADGTIKLFIDAPFAITVGMRGHLRPGCDGLFTTCKSKWSNGLNHPGGHLQPKPEDLMGVAQ